jgi:M6 family metalloprotease-like protein
LRFACYVALSVVAVGPRAHGDAVFGEVFPLTQPDGTRIDVRIWGDEFYRVVETLDGYTLVHDPAAPGAFYARLSPDGNELVSTGVSAAATLPAGLTLEKHIRINPAAARARIAAVRASFAQGEAEVPPGLRGSPSPSPPIIGQVVGIVLLVDFSDDPATIPASSVDSYCNLPGYTGYGNNGSVRDYFYAVSNGLLTYTNFVPTTYYRAAHPRSYYEDLGVPFGVRARELMLEALNDLDYQGFDFSQYDSDGDGRVDGINMFYAGQRGSVWAEGLWPHSSSIWFSVDGVSTYRYQMTNMGGNLTLSTFCHENGHMICNWPDLYDYDYDSSGVGRFCLMCYSTSSTNPQEPCAYMKYRAGWATSTLLTTPQEDLPVPPADSNVMYKFEHPSLANEYYLIENRQKSGRDSGLPDAGLAIWHIDTYGSNNNQHQTPSSHYRVTLVQADGRWDLENNRNAGDTTDLFKAPTYTECTPATNPNTNWWSGGTSGLYVDDISPSGSNMTFTFCTGQCVAGIDPPALPYGVEHQAPKHRYLSIDSSTNEATRVAYRVDLTSMRRCQGELRRACTLDSHCPDVCDNDINLTCIDDGVCAGGNCVPTGPCAEHPDVGLSWWVQAPREEPLGCPPGGCGPTDQFARVDVTPRYGTWNLSTLHIGDCEIVPGATYEIRVCLPPDGTVCSDPLTIPTTGLPLLAPEHHGNYGDVAGPVDETTETFAAPDGFANVVDITAFILTKQNHGTVVKPQTHPTWVDLHGLGNGNPPQYILNVSDLQQILFGHLGSPWTQSPGNLQPGDCP